MTAKKRTLDDERLTAVGLLFEATAGLRRALLPRIENECGIPPAWFEILLRLARTPDQRLRMTDLAAQALLTPSGLTRAVDRLQSAGLVSRDECPTDRRVVYAVLTPAGKALVDRVVPGHVDDIDTYLTGILSPSELARFAATLRKVRDHVHPEATTATAEGPP